MAGEGEHKEDGFNRESEDDVEFDDAEGAAAEVDRFTDFTQVIGHEGHVCSLDGRVGSGSSHRDSEACGGHGRGHH